jgi:hypothetical protein
MTQTFKPNIGQYKVLTPDGFKSFAGISLMGKKSILRLDFEQNKWLECTFDHKIFVSNTTYRLAKTFKPGDVVLSELGPLKVVSVRDLNRTAPVYDLIEVEDGHRYYTNTVVSSNCKFLIFDETLINSISLSDMDGAEPIMKMGQARWYKKINPASTYIVSLDPSLGTGGDFAAIEIIELPSMHQVCEWHHNMTPVQAQARILRDLLRYIDDQCQAMGVASSIYYSVENNTLGESALVAINELGEDTFPGLFLSEPIKKGHVRRFRKGFNTTHSAKIAACAKLKQLIESKQFKIYSKPLISELKTFVAQGITFKAKTGQHDDLVASLLLSIRMVLLLQDWDPTIYDKMRDHTGMEEHDLPLPIYISSY